MTRDLRPITSLVEDLDEAAAELAHGQRMNVDPDDAAHGLARLVLTLVELLRQLMERQAIRRMDAGTLTEQQVDRLGDTFLQLDRRMTELKQHFGLADEDLNLDLGPLGRLL
jgi:hypothetical protein